MTDVTDAVRSDARELDLFALPDDYFDNPAPYFRLLRDGDPFHWNSDGSLLLTRFQDVRQIWRDTSGVVDKSEMFRAKFGEGPLLEHHTTSMLFRDPPDHDRLRAVVETYFMPTRIKTLRPFVEQVVQETIDSLENRDEIDFVSEFAFLLPVNVICRILGLPVSDAHYIQALGRKVLFPLNPRVDAEAIAAGHAAAEEFREYLRGFVTAARKNPALDPSDNVIATMVAAERAGHQISENEMLHMGILLLNGGHETTTNLISQSINALLDDPAARAAVTDGSVPIEVALEELIRFVTPLQLQGRRTTREITLESGLGTIPAGTEVIICQASANRDNRVFEEPDRLNLTRRPNNHVAFGAGVHVCLGRSLARIELSVAIPAVLRNFPKLARSAPPVFNRNTRFRGLNRMPVRLR